METNMSKNKESKDNRSIMERLEAMGMKMTPKDHPIYTMNHASIRFISKRSISTKNGGDNEK